MSEKLTDQLLYILKCLIGTAIGYYIYVLHPTVGTWALFSIVLVLAPDRHDAMNLAVTRIKANFIGAATGLILLVLHPINLAMICVGIALSIAICELLKLQVATRSAMIAVLIITMHEPGEYFWEIALERAGGVAAGCIIGVALTYLFHISVSESTQIIQKVRKGNGSDSVQDTD
ncbi:MAG: FUSC family protein [Dyadobacter sp.]